MTRSKCWNKAEKLQKKTSRIEQAGLTYGSQYKTALTAVEKKIPDVNNLVKKTDYDIKICQNEKKHTDHNHNKYTATPEFITLAADVFNARLAQANLVTKTDFDNTVSSPDSEIAANIAKNQSTENELKKLKTFDLRQKSLWRWHTKVFSISANKQIF